MALEKEGKLLKCHKRTFMKKRMIPKEVKERKSKMKRKRKLMKSRLFYLYSERGSIISFPRSSDS